MTWACEFTEQAREDLRRLPKAIQKRGARVVTQIGSDPFQGEVKALKGEEWHGVFRRRIRDYRLLFTVERSRERIVVYQISLRSGKTYH